MGDSTRVPPRRPASGGLLFADSCNAQEKLDMLLARRDDSEAISGDAICKLERLRASASDGCIADYLARRAAGRQHASRWRQEARRVWTRLVPTATHAGVDLGFCPRRFSPGTGTYLVGFGRGSLPVLVVCRVRYSGAHSTGSAHLHAQSAASAPDATLTSPGDLPQAQMHGRQLSPEEAARRMFTHVHDVSLGASHGSVCRDFCLFTDDEAHAIVATAVSAGGFASSRDQAVSEQPCVRAHHAGFCVPSTNVHSLQDMGPPDNVCLHSVCMHSGRVCDRLELRGDYVLLSGHAGVAMAGRRLAVLSVRHQVVWLFAVDKGGHFLPDGAVGAHVGHGPFAGDVYAGALTLGVKQRIQAFLARRGTSPEERARLHAHSDALAALAMCRVQFLDTETLLVRLSCPEAVGTRGRLDLDAGTQQTSFFAALRLPAAEVLFFERSTSEMLVDVAFGAPSASSPGEGHCWAPSAANEMHERAAFERHADLLAALRAGHGSFPGDEDAPMRAMSARRALQSMPFAPQTTSESPLLDTALFRYDDRAIGPAERPRAALDGAVRFYSRRTDRMLFELDAALPADTPDPVGSVLSAAGGARPRRYTSWSVHPSLPLIISAQHNVVRASHVNVHFKPD